MGGILNSVFRYPDTSSEGCEFLSSSLRGKCFWQNHKVGLISFLHHARRNSGRGVLHNSPSVLTICKDRLMNMHVHHLKCIGIQALKGNNFSTSNDILMKPHMHHRKVVIYTQYFFRCLLIYG